MVKDIPLVPLSSGSFYPLLCSLLHMSLLPAGKLVEMRTLNGLCQHQS